MADLGTGKRKLEGWAPSTVLVFFTLVNLLTYYDRGALSGALTTVQKHFDLDKTEGGLLGGSFMLGYAVASPIFAHFAPNHSPLKLMGLGLFIWCLSTAASGAANSFILLLFARMVTGVGEASFLCLAPPFIDKFAPKESRSKWLAIFYVAIPLGYAIGTTVSSQLCQSITGYWGWRIVFLSESVVMLVFVVLCCTVDIPYFTFAKDPEEPDEESPLFSGDDSTGSEPTLRTKLLVLAHNPVYMCIVLAYAAQTFVVGGFAYIGVEYVQKGLHYSKSSAGRIFGIITALTGIFGTWFGGWILDRLRRAGGHRANDAASDDYSSLDAHTEAADVSRSLAVGMRLITFISALALPCSVMAFVLAPYHGGVLTFTLMGVAEFLLFACISPINACIMWAVPFEYNPIAIAMSVVGIHALGDASSPVIAGRVQDQLNDWDHTMILLSMWLLWPVLLFGLGAVFAERRARKTVHMGVINDRSESTGLTTAGADSSVVY